MFGRKVTSRDAAVYNSMVARPKHDPSQGSYLKGGGGFIKLG